MNEIYKRRRFIESSMKIYGRSGLTGEQRQRRFMSCEGLIQTCLGNPSFLDDIFLLPKVKKTVLKERGFTM
jgi:hypothetical protein